jgi:hypothetical protein
MGVDNTKMDFVEILWDGVYWIGLVWLMRGTRE